MRWEQWRIITRTQKHQEKGQKSLLAAEGGPAYSDGGTAGFCEVSELSRLFDVTEETIRRIWKAGNNGYLKRTYGGAVSVTHRT